MTNSRFIRLLLALAATIALVAVGCSSGDDLNATATDDDAATTTVAAASNDEPDTTVQEADADLASAEDDAPTDPPVEADEETNADTDDSADTSETTIPEDETDVDTSVDDDTTTGAPDDELDSGQPNFDEPSADEALAEILSFIGITDVEGATECIAGEADQAGITVQELVDSEGLMIAAIRCERDEIAGTMREAFSEIDTSSIAATPEQIDCSFDATIDFLAAAPIVGSEDLFGSDAPPELLQALVDTCGVSEADADFLLNEA